MNVIVLTEPQIEALIAKAIQATINELQPLQQHQAPNDTENRLIPQQELCKLLNITEQTLIRHKHNGILKDIKVGRKSFYTQETYRKLLEESE